MIDLQRSASDFSAGGRQMAGDPHLAHVSMAHLFRGGANRHPTREALVADGARLTFATLDARTDRIAAALAGLGIGRGDIFGTLLLDGVAMVELLIAAAKLGTTTLTMNWRLAGPEIAAIIEDARPKAVFVSACFVPLAQAAGYENGFVIPDADPDGLANVLGLTETSPALDPLTPVSPHDPWYLLYTSGTTGRGKGCLHSQGSYYVSALAMSGFYGLRHTDRYLVNSPLFHVAGISALLAAYAAGACTHFAPRHFGTEATLRMVAAEGITFQSLPILDSKGYLALQKELRLPLAIRMVIGGGGMTPRPVLEAVRDTLHADMVLGYGQSEAGGFSTLISLADQLERPTSCGKPMPHLQAMIADAQGSALPDGEHGELLLRGAGLTLGYLNLPEPTAQALEGGWLRTGDLAWRDADGFLHYAGRSKELIKSAGENVYPAEVENALASYPAVKDVCVVGVRDSRFGEAVKAFVVLNEGAALTPREAADWCRQTIAGYKRPRYVEFLDEIPRNFQGKPQRVVLSQRPVGDGQATD